MAHERVLARNASGGAQSSGTVQGIPREIQRYI